MSNEPEKPTPESEDAPPPAPESSSPESEAAPESPPAPEAAPESPPAPAPAGGGGADKKLVAGILGILLGSLGIHKFYLGYQKEGIIMLVVTLVLGGITCGAGASVTAIIGLIEGIMYLTKSDEEFEQTYITNQKPWF